VKANTLAFPNCKVLTERTIFMSKDTKIKVRKLTKRFFDDTDGVNFVHGRLFLKLLLPHLWQVCRFLSRILEVIEVAIQIQSRSVNSYVIRGHPGLNWGHFDLQSNALPLSYTPTFQIFPTYLYSLSFLLKETDP
jgi:hypothetical protein